MSIEDAAVRFNYAAGPAQLPAEVIHQAAEAVRSFPPHARSILELSHRSPEFDAIAEQAAGDLRALLALPDDYETLFLNGGARVHYSLWVQNLSAPGDRLGLVNSGFWSRLAIEEARRLRDIRVFPESPDPADYPDLTHQDTEDLAFLHYVSNETLTGLAMPPPEAACPLICDCTSDFMSKPFDLRPYALCYAGTQKNLGTAGLTVLVVHRARMREKTGLTPGLSYAAQTRAGCRYHTPSIYAWYVCALMLRWICEQGGLEEMERRGRARADRVYNCIEASSLYSSPITPRARSRMNLCFRLAEPRLEAAFLRQAETAGLAGLRGHRATGGIRASLYNAMPMAGVEALVEFMRDFERQS